MKVEESLKKYLFETLGIDTDLYNFSESDIFPRYLNDLYTYKYITIYDRPYLLAFPLSPLDETPASVRKHFDRLRDIIQKDVIFVCDFLPGWNRKRFIDNRISFIIPGNQLYLPLLGLDLKEYVRLPSLKNEKKALSPLTQEIIMRIFRERNQSQWSGAEISQVLGVSLMTAHRAFDELAFSDAFTVTKDGKRRCLIIERPLQVIWEILKPSFSNPVIRTVFIEEHDLPKTAFLSGLSALAQETLLAPPDVPVYAMKMSEWNRYKKEHCVRILSMPDRNTVELELWRYEPDLNTGLKSADILSVCLSLENRDDERIAQAIDHAIGEILC